MTTGPGVVKLPKSLVWCNTKGSSPTDTDPTALRVRRALQLPIAYMLAASAGVLFFLAFPTVGIWQLAFVAVTPLVVALEGQRPRQALLLGLCAGFVMNATGFWWLAPALHSFSRLPAMAYWPVVLLIWTYQAGRAALLAWSYVVVRQRGWPSWSVFALAFVATEFIFPLPIPWCFAASVQDVPVLLQTLELGGPYLTGMILISPGVALGSIMAQKGRNRKQWLNLIATGVLPIVVAFGYGVWRMRQVDLTTATAKKVRVGVVHDYSPRRLSGAQRFQRLRDHLAITDELRLRNAQFVVWSETVISTMNSPGSRGVDLGRSLRADIHVPLITGAMVDDTNNSYNSALSADSAGYVGGRYDKQELFAIGEYIPLGDVFPRIYEFFPYSSRLTRGTIPDPLTILGHNITAVICYEDMLPGHTNRLVYESKPGLLVALSNDAWFANSNVPRLHFALSRLRAVEHRRYMIRATNAGVSAVIDPTGRVVASTSAHKMEALEATVSWLEGTRTPYELLGDIPCYIATALLIAMGLPCLLRRPLTA